jgi:tRNA(Ile2) C34 agmatinyltransferase TiaS
MKQIHAYKIDLTRIDGRGDFQCPRCGTTISPDDDSEERYVILEAKMNRDELDTLVVRCNMCGRQIHLTGFSLLQNLERRKESDRYIAHL